MEDDTQQCRAAGMLCLTSISRYCSCLPYPADFEQVVNLRVPLVVVVVEMSII